ncbi:MAG: transglutaminase-like domain-containing protein [Ramlibacter sp.]
MQALVASLPSHECIPDPGHWRGSSDLLDLEDTRLRLRARALTQLCKTEREKALAVYAFVKRMPLGKPLKLHLRTAREVLDAGSGDSPDKATLAVALLRLAGIPARMRYVEYSGEVVRGLVPHLASGSRPILEAWIGGRWVATDTYIFDPPYMAAARHRLKALGWERGFGIDRDGHAIWNGTDAAWALALAPELDPMCIHDHGCWHDPHGFETSEGFLRKHRPLTRRMHWNMLAPLMDRAIRDLRGDDAGLAPNGPRRRP